MDSSSDLQQTQKSLGYIRLVYFFQFAGLSIINSYINVYFKGIGLTGFQIGLINTILPMVAIFSAPLWGVLNDRLGKPRLLLRVAIPGVILVMLVMSGVQDYGGILFLVCVYSLFNGAIIPLLDNTTLGLLGTQRERYGTYRAWGSIGFMVSTLISGFVFERTGLNTLFYAYAILMGIFFLVSFGLPDQPIRLSGSLWRGMGQMVRQPLWLLFAVCVFLVWFASSGMYNFLGITIKVMGGSAGLIGIAWAMGNLTEIPVMLLGSRLLQKAGPARLLAVAFSAYFIRMLLYTVMPSPSWVPFINLMHGFTFGFFWLSAVNYASRLAPAQLKTTSQGMLTSIMNLSTMVGAVSNGWIYDRVGPSRMFLVAAGFALAALLLFATGQLIIRRRNARIVNPPAENPV